VFKGTWFSRFAGKEGITDGGLRGLVNDVLEAGLADADLGGGVYKVRIARPGEGKSGGYRVIVFFRSGERTFFHYAYPKSSRDNINQKEMRSFKRMARINLAMSNSELADAVNAGEFVEI